ncbi:GNAT family N-acetyltransferase [Paenibacillus sp. FSL K6-1217]|uniref:GNAT family N-acetyltransferase n=1 Tax=Paenibacillus sp. FSL K6-1217 TaxID=2921466 RepID=UPI00324576BB
MNNYSIDPILIPVPESFESSRLHIRAARWGDGPAVNEAVRESADELSPWMPWAQRIPTVEESEVSIRKSRLQFLERSDIRLLLFHKSTGQLIGSSGLHRIDWQVRKFEIGYWAHTSYTGQGYITEAVNAITDFAIQELQANRLEIRCDSRNTQSSRVAERTGFTLEGILRNDKTDVQGNLRDTMIYSKVRGIEY